MKYNISLITYFVPPGKLNHEQHMKLETGETRNKKKTVQSPGHNSQ